MIAGEASDSAELAGLVVDSLTAGAGAVAGFADSGFAGRAAVASVSGAGAESVSAANCFEVAPCAQTRDPENAGKSKIVIAGKHLNDEAIREITPCNFAYTPISHSTLRFILPAVRAESRFISLSFSSGRAEDAEEIR
jgi:hypothetical protein